MEKLRKGQKIVNWMHENDTIADRYPYLEATLADFTRRLFYMDDKEFDSLFGNDKQND